MSAKLQKDPASKIACPSAEELRQYLSGWTEEERAEDIDEHVADCANCNAILREFENGPETFLQSLRSTVGHPDPMIRDSSQQHQANQTKTSGAPDEEDSVVAAALDKARRLADGNLLAAPESAASAWKPAVKELGGYELIRPLGRGGMGAVYLAQHRQLRKTVAIKLLPMMSGEDSSIRARFEREIRVVGKLNHPSIVAATDAGEIDGTQFLVMEYVSGLDLSRIARLMGRLPVAESCELIRQVALGLSCAHAEGVVHRDVKPSNLMLDDAGRIRILDFGLAQTSVWDEVSVDLTTVGQLMGTLDYMAPEQAELSSSVDYRADLYALGATLFRLLCGRPPLAAAPNQSPLEKLRLLANHAPPKLDTLCPEAPPELVKLVASMLSRNPLHRPASAAHVAEQLAPFVAGSKLIELLEAANQKAATVQEEVKKPDAGLRRAGAVGASEPIADGAPCIGSMGTGRGGKLRWLLWGGLLPLILIAGILIKLELNKGQLVIESEVDNVHIRLLRDNKPVEGIQVSQGVTSTRLQADQYEITVEGASDALVIDKDQFTLKNGEIVVARIRRESRPVENAMAPNNAIAPRIPDKAAPLIPDRESAEYAPTPRETSKPWYEGEPLDHWLDVLKRERSGSGLRTAFQACTALGQGVESDRVADAVITLARGMDNNINLAPERVNGALGVDHYVSSLLYRILPDARFTARWVKEFESGDHEWRQRLWQNYAAFIFAGSEDRMEPFVAWAEELLKQPTESTKFSSEDLLQAADQLRGTVRISQNGSEAFRNRVVLVLDRSPHLPLSWWLSVPSVRPVNRGEAESSLWPTVFKEKMTRRAVETLLNMESESNLVVQGAMILASEAELTEEQKSRTSAAVNLRLEALAKDRRLMTQMVTVGSEFSQFLPSFDSGSPMNHEVVSFEIRPRRNGDKYVFEHSTAMQLLNLAWTLDKGIAEKSGVDQIFAATKPTLERILAQEIETNAKQKARGRGPYGGSSRIQLTWPALDTASGQANADVFSGDVPKEFRAATRIWGDHNPTREDWLEYFILRLPIMTPNVVNAMQAAELKESTPATTDNPQPQPDVPDFFLPQPN